MIFKKARQASPAIVFIDEIDSIAPKRGLQTSSGVTERIVNQLLTSIDGLESLERVLVLARHEPARHPRRGAASHRAVRPAPLRRAPRTREGRLEILKVHTRKMPLRGRLASTRSRSGPRGTSEATSPRCAARRASSRSART